jgi:hypothetical protein
MADPISETQLAQEVDDLLGQLKTDPFGTRAGNDRSGSGSGGPAPIMVGSGVVPEHRAWTKALVVLALGVGLAFWPYANRCGLGLTSYMAALGVLLATAAWSLQAAWRQRSARAYALGLAILVWGAGLTLAQVLPRTGYASQVAFWSCQAGMAAQPPVGTEAGSPTGPGTQPHVPPTGATELPPLF